MQLALLSPRRMWLSRSAIIRYGTSNLWGKIFLQLMCWTIKKAECQRINAFELWWWRRLLRVPWTIRKEIKVVHPKGNQSWIFTGRTDAEAEAPILWPPDAKSWLTGKDPDAGKDWRQEEKGVAEDDQRASPTQWIWVWANSGRWWRTGKPDTLQSKGSQRVRHDLATEQEQWLSLCLQDKLLLWKQLKLKQTYMA